jgi:hypothetical protein
LRASGSAAEHLRLRVYLKAEKEAAREAELAQCR